MGVNDVQRILQTQRISEQHIQNYSFDTDFQCLFVEIAGYDATSDSLKRIACDDLGRILISPLSASTNVWEYGYQNTVADNSLATLLVYTVAVSDLYLDKVMASGTVDAEYQILINGDIKAKYMTSEQDRTAKFEFPVAQKISVGDILTVKVIHFRTDLIGDFNASIIGHK